MKGTPRDQGVVPCTRLHMDLVRSSKPHDVTGLIVNCHHNREGSSPASAISLVTVSPAKKASSSETMDGSCWASCFLLRASSLQRFKARGMRNVCGNVKSW